MPIWTSFLSAVILVIAVIISGIFLYRKNRYSAFYLSLCVIVTVSFFILRSTLLPSLNYSVNENMEENSISPEEIYEEVHPFTEDTLSFETYDSLETIFSDSVRHAQQQVDALFLAPQSRSSAYASYWFRRFSVVVFDALFPLLFILSILNPFIRRNKLFIKIISILILIPCAFVIWSALLYPGIFLNLDM